MSPADQIAEREAFEAWARHNNLGRGRHYDGYWGETTDYCWSAWQAGRAALAQPEQTALRDEIEAANDMLELELFKLDIIRGALRVEYEPHQSMFRRMVDAANAKLAQQSNAPALTNSQILFMFYNDHAPGYFGDVDDSVVLGFARAVLAQGGKP